MNRCKKPVLKFEHGLFAFEHEKILDKGGKMR